ncbi:MAG TPA: YraN family protein [Solirubrobacteraceae bacterium]|nr:YraN family protein [Solirubrobacteraceae bacterium]
MHPDARPARSSAPPAIRGPGARRSLGALGEELAAAHLRRLDFAVLARNVRTRHGEIDLIACDGSVLAFVEVKTRRASSGTTAGPGPDPLAGLGVRQRVRLRRLAAAWLADGAAHRPTARTIRFDAIGVTVDRRGRLLRLEHLAGAW